MQATQAVEGVQYAGFWTRFGANLIDGIIVTVVEYALIFTLGVAGYVLALIVGIVYTIGLWTARGQTLGKMAMRVRIVKTDGTPVTLGTAILRYVGYWVSAIILLIGYLMVAWDPKKQGLHDKIAGTYVVKV